MKIWYQSTSPYRYQSVFDDYGKSLEEQCQRIVRPGTHVHVEGTEVMPMDITHRKFLSYYVQIQTINCLMEAEKQGYDAFVIGCALDIGLDEGRSLVDMPVVGIAEAGYHLAAMMGNLFAVVTSSAAFFEICNAQVEKYGLCSRYLPGPYLHETGPDEIAAALKKPETLMDKYMAVAEKAADDGASVIIPSPIFITSLFNKTGVNKVKGAVILDSVSAAVKTAELMVDLKRAGVEPARRIGVFAKPDPKTKTENLARLGRIFTMNV